MGRAISAEVPANIKMVDQNYTKRLHVLPQQCPRRLHD